MKLKYTNSFVALMTLMAGIIASLHGAILTRDGGRDVNNRSTTVWYNLGSARAYLALT